jgi:hypothetical protein
VEGDLGESLSFIAENHLARDRRTANLAHLRKEAQDVVTVRVGIGQQVKVNWGVSNGLVK